MRESKEPEAAKLESAFAAVVSLDGGEPIATHIPIEITKNSKGDFVLEGHVARANPHWKTLEQADEVLTIISGAHAYISPCWYDEPHSTVPTWSYMIVQVNGKAVKSRFAVWREAICVEGDSQLTS